MDESPTGDESTSMFELRGVSHFPQWHVLGQQLMKIGGSSSNLCPLACLLKEMSFGGNWKSPPSRPLNSPGPNASQASRQQGRKKSAIPMDSDEPKDNEKDNGAGDGSTGVSNAPPPFYPLVVALMHLAVVEEATPTMAGMMMMIMT